MSDMIRPRSTEVPQQAALRIGRHRVAYRRSVRHTRRLAGWHWSGPGNIRAAAVMFVLAGVALLTAVVWAWRAWASPRAPAQIADCHQITAARGRWYPGGRQILDSCRVSWSTNGSRHTGTVNLPVGHYRPGDTVTLTIHDDSAQVPASPQPLIYLAAIILVAVTFGRWLLPPANPGGKHSPAASRARPVDDLPTRAGRDDVPPSVA
jgi:hypothetical protein